MTFFARPNADNSERIAHLEAKFENLAPRAWVQEVLQPVEKSIARMEQAITSLTEDSKALYVAHEKMIQDRAKQQAKEHEERMRTLKEAADQQRDAAEKAAEQQRDAAEKAAQQAEKSAEKSTFVHFVEKKATPILVFISALCAVLMTAAGAFVWWLTHYVPQLHK